MKCPVILYTVEIDEIMCLKAFEDTLVLFLSDTGASAEIMVRGDGHDPKAPPGSAYTYLCLGPGWSTTCNTPFRRHKTWVHEGGCATPLVVHWPNGIQARGEVRHTVGHVIDIVPTILEIAGDKARKKWDDRTAPEAPGQSLLHAFTGDDKPREAPIWFSHDGHRAIREDNWKLVAAKDDKWELYNLAEDRNEVNNLAGENPQKVRQMEARWMELQGNFGKVARTK